jgi:hypothetical protein
MLPDLPAIREEGMPTGEMYKTIPGREENARFVVCKHSYH